MGKMRILIADDHEVVRKGIRTLLETRSEWEICGEASTGWDAVAKAKRQKPDVVLLDISMPDLGGLEAIPEILKVHPNGKILVLTMHESGRLATRVLAAGASGLILKSDAGLDLVRAVQSIERNQPFLSPAVTTLIIGDLAKNSVPGPSPSVTPRELEVLRLLALGRTNKEVASALKLSVKTVEAHRFNIMRKLDLRTYSDLIQYAIRQRIIEV